ncbi:Heavy metal-associated domain [Macleaya cordata]|uniref:Heavy metal-associated domain n=1 Tax=Macleaya cordata TaxID=56857 RepID=A0A200Q087_MACCD|nr:Heavy metal-associated domain [Macleaya cordata]
MFRCFKESSSRPSNAMAIVELLVHMDCEGCQRRIRKAISKLEGVDSVDIDMDNQKVTVTGYVDQRRVLKRVRRTGRKAEFWPYPYDGEYHPFAGQYLEDSTYSSTYNYYQHGYNESVHGYFPNLPYSTIIDDHTAHFFNDENVYACTIM